MEMIQLKLPLLDQVTIVSGRIAIRYRISSSRFEVKTAQTLAEGDIGRNFGLTTCPFQFKSDFYLGFKLRDWSIGLASSLICYDHLIKLKT